MNSSIATWLASVALCATSAMAQSAPFEIDGRIVVSGVGVDDVFDFDVVVRDEAGVSVVEFTEFGVIVVGGDFAFALDDDAVSAAVDDGTLLVEVSVASLGLTAPAAIGALPVVATTETAALAVTAQTATTLGALARADLVTATQLATVGAASVSYDNVTGRPNGIDDGDQGTIDAVGAGLVRTGTSVDVANGAVTSAKIVDATVTGAAIADGAVGAAQVQNVVGSNFATATLTSADFANAGIASTDLSGNLKTIFQFPSVCDGARPITTSSSPCFKQTGCPSGQVRNCTTELCEVGVATTCPVIRIGQLLFAP